jgi:hypothetical protein
MSKDLLTIEARVLLLRYGRKRLLEAFAALSNESPEQLESDLNLALTAAEHQKARPRSKTVSASELTAHFSIEDPDKVQALKSLAIRFDNHAFLPGLKDVQRFLDRMGSTHHRFRSRREASREVMVILSRLQANDLKQLLVAPDDGRGSDFALLAEEIMGGSSTKRERK